MFMCPPNLDLKDKTLPQMKIGLFARVRERPVDLTPIFCLNDRRDADLETLPRSSDRI